MIHLMRLPRVQETLGMGKATVYDHIKEGLLPPPVNVGPKSSAWPSNEIERVVAARIAGKSDAEVRVIVERMVGERQHALSRAVA